MEFFRKHQRLLFSFITALAILSIVFLGIYSPDVAPPYSPSNREHAQLVEFLTANPQIVQRDLIETGIKNLIEPTDAKNLVEIAAQWMTDAAIAAEEAGWNISLETAKRDLYRNRASIVSLGFDLETLGLLWRKILLARALLHINDPTQWTDPLVEREICSYANERRLLELYHWPQELTFRSMEDLALFQIYLYAIAPCSQDPLSLPTERRPLAEIKAAHPELFITHYTARVAQVDASTLFHAFGAKQRLLWQLEDASWDKLNTQFTALPKVSDKKLRLQALEALPSLLRKEVDRYSRSLFLEEHRDELALALKNAPDQETSIYVSLQSASLPDISRTKIFASLMHQASQGDLEAETTLLAYAGDKTLYAIKKVRTETPARLMTFAEVKQNGVLRKALPHSEEEMRSLLRPLCVALDRAHKTDWAEGQGPVGFYTSYRLFQAAETERTLRQQGKDPLSLFSMQCEEKWVLRQEQPALFSFPLNYWSQVEIASTKSSQYVHIKEQRPAETVSTTAHSLHPLGREATLYAAQNLLHRMQRTSENR